MRVDALFGRASKQGVAMIVYDCEERPPTAEEFLDYGYDPASRYEQCGATTPATARIGSTSPHATGPAGTRWTAVSLARERRAPVVQYYQELEIEIVPHAIIRVGNAHSVDLHVRNATPAELELFNNTFCIRRLVPMDHLRRVVQIRPDGIHVANTTGAPNHSLSYMGGVNQARRIVITRGALLDRADRDISTTVLHEIGHVMTHPGDMYLNISEADRSRVGEGTSRNEGELEGLCNAYMYLLCYGSEHPPIRGWGERNSTPTARNILRQCTAFTRLTSDDIVEDWTARLAERS